MATVERSNLGLLNDKLTVRLKKEDYLPAFEKKLKEYSKNANIPGFRKGMVPAGMIKKMYGPGIFSDEVLRTIEKELYTYLDKERPDIFAQPLPMEGEMSKLDMNNPGDFDFSFEVGLKPEFKLPDLGKAKLTRNNVEVTDAMLNEEIERMRTIPAVEADEEKGTEARAEEKRELNEEFFNAAFPGKGISTEAELKVALKEEMTKYWEAQTRNQLQDQIYHLLLDDTTMEFPQQFLTRWLKNGGDKERTPEEAEQEYPLFQNQLKWTLISDTIIRDNKLDVTEEELRAHMREEVGRYFGQMNMGEDMSWLDSYLDRMMKDEKQVDATYRRLVTEKLFTWAEAQTSPKDKTVTSDELVAMQHNHQH